MRHKHLMKVPLLAPRLMFKTGGMKLKSGSSEQYGLEVEPVTPAGTWETSVAYREETNLW